MSRDGLLPKAMAKVHPHTGTPITVIVLCGIPMALTAGLLPLDEIAELVNIGTLAAFTLVCAGVIVLRKQQPRLKRFFRVPWSPLTPALGMLSCGYRMANLPAVTWLRFVIWMAVGLVFYFGYARQHSRLADTNA